MWWREFHTRRVKQGKEKITSWAMMREKLRGKYFPSYYKETLYHRPLSLRRRNKSVQEYIEEFDLLTMRNAVPKDEQKVA